MKSRNIESFDKECLVKFIKKFFLGDNAVKTLEYIEWDIKVKKLLSKSKELVEEIDAARSCGDRRRYLALDKEWERVHKRLNKLLHCSK